jgi:TolA-binding protein
VSTESEDGHSVGTSFSLHGDADEAALERARGYSRDGRFADADAVLTRLWQSAGTDPGIREKALFELGELWSNLLNPKRDEDRAAGYFRRFLEDYPGSEQAPEARDALARLAPEPAP